jgi:hypothetical protein
MPVIVYTCCLCQEEFDSAVQLSGPGVCPDCEAKKAPEMQAAVDQAKALLAANPALWPQVEAYEAYVLGWLSCDLIAKGQLKFDHEKPMTLEEIREFLWRHHGLHDMVRQMNERRVGDAPQIFCPPPSPRDLDAAKIAKEATEKVSQWATSTIRTAASPRRSSRAARKAPKYRHLDKLRDAYLKWACELGNQISVTCPRCTEPCQHRPGRYNHDATLACVDPRCGWYLTLIQLIDFVSILASGREYGYGGRMIREVMIEPAKDLPMQPTSHDVDRWLDNLHAAGLHPLYRPDLIDGAKKAIAGDLIAIDDGKRIPPPNAMTCICGQVLKVGGTASDNPRVVCRSNHLMDAQDLAKEAVLAALGAPPKVPERLNLLKRLGLYDEMMDLCDSLCQLPPKSSTP